MENFNVEADVYSPAIDSEQVIKATQTLNFYKRSKANLEKIKNYDISVVEKEIKDKSLLGNYKIPFTFKVSGIFNPFF